MTTPLVRAFRERVWLARNIHQEGTFLLDSESEARNYMGRVGWQVREYRLASAVEEVSTPERTVEASP